MHKLSSAGKDFEQSMLLLRGELSENKVSLENLNSLLKQKEQQVENLNSLLKQKERTASEVKAQLDTREATVSELQSKLFWTEFANKVLLKDDERQKKEIATLEQKLSQYKQAYEQVQAQDVRRNSGLVLELQKCSERNMELSKTNERLQNDLLHQKEVEGVLRKENHALQQNIIRFSEYTKKQKFCLLKQIRRLTRTSISTGVSFTLEDSKWIFSEATQLRATTHKISDKYFSCKKWCLKPQVIFLSCKPLY